jgi:uncharacterized protein (TIGR01777 family)
VRVIITGGSGLIGRPLTTELTKNGYEVIILSRSPDRVKGLPKQARAVRWDGRTSKGWVDLVKDRTAIINLAGENLAGAGFFPKRWTPDRKHRILQSRLHAGYAVNDAVSRAAEKPTAVIQSSGVGFYGHRGDEAISEDAPPGSDWLARVGVQWENSTQPVEALGIRRVIIRSAGVFSTDGGVLPRAALPFRLFFGGPVGSGKQWVPWIHIADHVRATRFLLEHPTAAGPFNLVAPNPVTNRDFGRALGRVLRRPAFVPIPAIIPQLAFGEMADLLLKGQRALPNRLKELGFSFQFPEIETALGDLLRR